MRTTMHARSEPTDVQRRHPASEWVARIFRPGLHGPDWSVHEQQRSSDCRQRWLVSEPRTALDTGDERIPFVR